MNRGLRDRIDAALAEFLDERMADVERLEPVAMPPAAEIRRLLDAGGKRIRPAFCYWGFRAAGGEDDQRIVRAAAALELLHTMALVHDDLMDGAKERRGVPATAPWFSERPPELGVRGDPEEFGTTMAVLVGDLAVVYADQLFLGSGFDPGAIVRAQADYHEMRQRMAVGQYLDVSGAAGDPEVARRAAVLKGGSYTVEGPLLIGASLAKASEAVRERLRAYGRPLGEAFQLRDDLLDGDAAPGISKATVNGLVVAATQELDPDMLTPEAVAALRQLADLVAM